MSRIKSVDEQNILDVCKLKAKQEDILQHPFGGGSKLSFRNVPECDL